MQVENDLHEDVEFRNELQHALDVLIDEHENVEIPFQSNVKSIMAYVEVREFIIFKNALVSQLDGNPTLSKDWLTWIKVGKLYMKPKHLSAANYDTMLIFGCDCGVCFLDTREARMSPKIKLINPYKKCGRPTK